VTVARAYDFYEPRTAHESSLSAIPYGVTAARLGRDAEASSFFLRSARYNLDYHPRGGYRNGLHLSAYAGAWQILAEGFAGLHVVDHETIGFQPRLPNEWTALRFPVVFRGRRLTIAIDRCGLTARCESGLPVGVLVGSRRAKLVPGESSRFDATALEASTLSNFPVGLGGC
jgi:trehalose/maltose hydrolase-like predicted phosphorylase